jgi:predicted molibdopterin-dependent oxidoreductase YjgC
VTAVSTGPLVQLQRPTIATDQRRRSSTRTVSLTIDEQKVSVREGTTILAACREIGIEIPTLCFLDTLHPINACRICVVEVEGGRVLVPSCSRAAEEGMVVHTQSSRVKHSRKLVLEMLASSVDLSTTPKVAEWIEEYRAKPERFGPPAPPAAPGTRDASVPGHHAAPNPEFAATVAEPTKIDNDLYVRDYAKCILCYKCVEACGPDHQNTFAIAVAGRGFDAHISTEFAVPHP